LLPNNPFLGPGSTDGKGGGRFLEEPASVPNIVRQTAANDPEAFEANLADVLMAVFADGIWELQAVVAELRARGCHDVDGAPWTESSFGRQLERSSARLFAVKRSPVDD
jgi:hypothetical protein